MNDAIPAATDPAAEPAAPAEGHSWLPLLVAVVGAGVLVAVILLAWALNAGSAQ